MSDITPIKWVLYTNKTQGWLSTGEINYVEGRRPKRGQTDVSKFIDPVDNQPSVLNVFYYFLNST